MSVIFDSGLRPPDFVLHPTDLSEASERAFHHALAVAIRLGAQFTLLHALGRRATDNWPGFPSVRSKLAQWKAAGTLDGLSERTRQASVSKIEVDIRDPVAASLQYIERNAVDMIVLGTTGRKGLARLVRAPRAELLARRSKLLTLFVPDGGRVFVDGNTGEVTLKRILIPVDPATDPRPAMVRAVNAATLLDDADLEITLLHIGEGSELESTELPDLPFCRWNAMQRSGDTVPRILETAEELEADAIYMTTTWSKTGFGRVEGGVTEGVLAGAPCPVMAVPVGRT
jgi:nucleotide-binding universal stress UspA family protein